MCLAIPARIIELMDDGGHLAMIEVGGLRRQIDTSLLDDPARPGDWVLIHVGFAMCKIGEAEALDQLETLRRLGEEEAAAQELRGYGLDEAAGTG